MKKLKPLVAALGAICMASAVSVQAETLLEIYQQAENNDHQYRAARARADAGAEIKNIARSQILPSVGAQAYWRDSEGTSITYGDTDAPPTDPTDPTNPNPVDPELYGVELETDTETTAYSVNVTQPLIDLRAWNSYQSGRSAAKAAGYEFASQQQELVVRTAEAYFDALNAVDYLATAEAESEALSSQLEQTRQRFEVGLTAITEVHEAQAAFDSATANRLDAEGQLGIAFEALEVLTGKSYNALSPLREDFPVLPPEPMDRGQWEEFAIENNPNLKVAWQNKETAEAEAAAAKSEHFPTVSAEAGYSDQEVEGFRAGESDGSYVQVSLNVPLFAGGGISAGRRQAYAEYVAAKEIYLQTKRDIIQSVRSSHLSVLTTAATVKARNQAIVSSRSALEATQAGYDVGTRDLVDVLNAQRNLYTAQRDYYSALYNYVLSTLRLHQSAGTLSGEQIVELNQWLNKDEPVIYTREL